MADSAAVRAFVGERFEDLTSAARRGVKQAGRAFKAGTRYTFRAGLSGRVDAELVESLSTASGLDLVLTPGPLVQEVGGSLSGGISRGRELGANSNGGLAFFAEVEILNAVALESDDDDEGGTDEA